MAINKLNVGLIDNVSATGNTQVSDGHVLTYVAANNAVEFKNLDLSISGTGTVSSNIESVNTSVTGDIDTVQDNISSTTTLVTSTETNIDTVQSNLDTFATYANTNYASDSANSFSTITVSDSNLIATSSSDNLTFISGNGISISANATAQSLTFDVYAGNIKSDYFVLDGTANTCTLSTSDRPNTSIYVTVGGLIQEAGINYVVSGETLTLINTYPIINGTDVEVRYLPYTGEIAASTPTGPSYTFGGTSYGYFAGGQRNSTVQGIDRFSFTSDAPSNETRVYSELGTRTSTAAGQSSDTSGYSSGGIGGAPGNLYLSNIQKFSFSSDANSTDSGQLSSNRGHIHGGNNSDSDGYLSGGWNTSVSTDIIEKFPFSSDTNGTNIASLAVHARIKSSQSSPTHGYQAGGFSDPAGDDTDAIQKWPFSSDSNATDIGELLIPAASNAGQSSPTHGYSAGGRRRTPSAVVDTIQKFPFSSESPSTDVGELAFQRQNGAGHSSTTHGYHTGGYNTGNAEQEIQKFPFASDTNATDIAEMGQNGTEASDNHTGHQV